jgi:hypothetical protein
LVVLGVVTDSTQADNNRKPEGASVKLAAINPIRLPAMRAAVRREEPGAAESLARNGRAFGVLKRILWWKYLVSDD